MNWWCAVGTLLAFCAVFVHRQDPGALVCHQNGKGCSIDCSSFPQLHSPLSLGPRSTAQLAQRDPIMAAAKGPQQAGGGPARPAVAAPLEQIVESFSPVVLSCAVPCFVSILCTLRLPTSPALRRSAISQAVDFRDPTRFNWTRSTISTINTPKPAQTRRATTRLGAQHAALS
jgi:hypothetical protein